MNSWARQNFKVKHRQPQAASQLRGVAISSADVMVRYFSVLKLLLEQNSWVYAANFRLINIYA